MLNRRTNAVAGCVNFPIHDPRYINSKEGGMFVRLLVLDRGSLVAERSGKKHLPSPEFLQCCGGLNFFPQDECFVGDGVTKIYHAPENATLHQIERELREREIREQSYFPAGRERESVGSIGVLVAMTIGSTGWSGFDQEGGSYWLCTEADLNEEGKVLVQVLKKIYSGHSLRLLTFLDT